MNCLPPISGFTSVGAEWVTYMYTALEPSVVIATADGPIAINDPMHDYDVLFGDILNDMQAAVQELLESSPRRLVAIVMTTVMLASLLGFRSLLIGPRLLLTVLYTLSFTFGLCVIMFQDLGGGE